MPEHGLHEYDPATGVAIPAQGEPLLSSMDTSMTLAFPENIKKLEKVFMEELAHDLTVTPQMQASARKDLECHTAQDIRDAFHMIYTGRLMGHYNEYANYMPCRDPDCKQDLFAWTLWRMTRIWHPHVSCALKQDVIHAIQPTDLCAYAHIRT